MAFWNSTPQQPAGAPGGAPQQPATLGATLFQGYQQLLMIKKQNPQIDLPAKLCDLIVEHAVKERASDIHIEGQGQNIRVRFRIDGIMHDMLAFKKDPNVPLMQRIRVLSGFDPEPSTSYKNEDGRFQKMAAGRR
jgi:type II secretory ATPase GspE/PulE/Tfp pilus assembly ATPase PilB-like protein